MKPLKIRYSLAIIAASIAVSIVFLYFSGNVLLSKFESKELSLQGDVSIITTDEAIELSKNFNYTKAVSAFNNKDYGVAIDELNEEIKKYPDHAQAYFLLGKIYEDVEFEEGRFYSKMLTNYEKYIELKPNGRRIDYVKLRAAQYYIQVGLTQQKIELLDKAEGYLKSLDQNNSDVRMALGAIYLDKQNYDKAISAFEKSTNLSPSELKLKYNSLGLSYIKKGSYAKAERILRIAVKVDPKDKYVHNNIGFVYAQQGKIEEAQLHFAEALKIDPTYENAKRNLLWVEKEISKK